MVTGLIEVSPRYWSRSGGHSDQERGKVGVPGRPANSGNDGGFAASGGGAEGYRRLSACDWHFAVAFIIGYGIQDAVVLLNNSAVDWSRCLIVVELLYNLSLRLLIFAAVLLFRHKRLYHVCFRRCSSSRRRDGSGSCGCGDGLRHQYRRNVSDRQRRGRTGWGPYMYKSKRVQNTFVEISLMSHEPHRARSRSEE